MFRALILVCAVMLAAAAPTAPAAQAVDGQGRAAPPEALFDALAAADVVVLGEQHDDPGAHRFELALLQDLARRGARVALAMEMFERDQQPFLDAYLAGRIAERDFLARVKTWPNYAADYRPLVELARRQGWRVVGSNVPRALAAQVSRRGWSALQALAPARRALAARELQCPQDAYYQRFRRAMAGGGAHGGDVENLFRAQCLKDETMAESLAGLIAPGTIVVHVNGAFHSDGRLGLVARTQRRAPNARIVVVSIVPAGAAAPAAGEADFVVRG